MKGTLGRSDHVLLKFLISKETKAECSCALLLDFLKVNFKNLRTRISKVPRQEILTKKESKKGGRF